MCENPARIFGLYPRKGCIQAGADADLIILNMKNPYRVRSEDLSMIIPPYSPFEGWEVSVKPETVILGGHCIVRQGKLITEKPRGRFVPSGNRPETCKV